MTAPPIIQAFFDEPTFSVSYLVADPLTKTAAIIDPVLDFDQRTGIVSARTAQRILDAADSAGFAIRRVLETHAHADHMTAAAFLKAKTGAQTGIGAHIGEVQSVFKPVFADDTVSTGGAEFDCLFHDGERIALGALQIEVLHTPGHTPACVCYRIGDAVFVGDTLFMPDFGTARTDFPGGDAATLYRSIRRILALPPQTRLFMCHDYKAPGREEYAWQTSVAEERERNIHIHDGIGEGDFVKMRQARDKTLAAPVLLLPALQVNIRAGVLPAADAQGRRFLRIPLTLDETLQ